MPQDKHDPKKGQATDTHSVVRECDCPNGFQDSWYGQGLRLHYESAKQYRCTACGAVKPK